LPPANLGAKPSDHHVEGGWLVTKLGGNFGHGAILDEESAQRLVLAVDGVGRTEEGLLGPS
jgi:hypothetical protein